MKLRVATVCAANMNRSMEAHRLLASKGIDVKSYGTNTSVRLPGPAIDKPNVYAFGTTYEEIRTDLIRKNPQLYKDNGVLPMVERNIKIKERPQKWIESRTNGDTFDLIITAEERVFNAIAEDFASRESESYDPVLLVNIELKDTHEEAVVGAALQLNLVLELQELGEEWSDEIDEFLESFESRVGRSIMHQTLFY